MSRIGKTIQDLNRYRQQMLRAMPGGLGSVEDLFPQETGPAGEEQITEIADFGENPGNLRLLAYVPEKLPSRPALVVVLHGCRQTALGYDRGTGWSQLAREHGFIVCLPEQQSGNNANHCFNWFQERDTSRDCGEAASIRAMIEHLAVVHNVDRSRIFVTGLSAGGAMAAAMLAAYPEVFAAGAVIAGLPYRVAVTVGEAFEAMSRGDRRPGAEAAASVRAASAHTGPWPRLSVWHGTADETVAHGNARALVRQWRHLNGMRAAPTREEKVSGQTRRVWADARGTEIIEEFVIEGLGHGTPLDGAPLVGAALGQSGPFLLEAGISSTRHIAEFWGLVPVRKGRRDGLQAMGLRG
jgi:feruloyl esterase